MAGINVVKGKITNSRVYKNDTFAYFVKDKGGITDKYIFFAKGTEYAEGLDSSREVTLKYVKKMSELHGNSNIVCNVEYGDYITDIPIITDFLVNRINLSKNFVNKLVEKYGNDTIDVVLKRTDTIRELNFANINEVLTKIEVYKKKMCNIDFTMELAKLGIPSRFHQAIAIMFNRDIARVKEDIYTLYLNCKIPFKKCDEIAIKLKYSRNNPNRILAFIKYIYKEFNHQGQLYVIKDIIEQKCQEYRLTPKLVIEQLVEILCNKNLYYTTKAIDKKEKYVGMTCLFLSDKPVETVMDFNEEYYVTETQLDPGQREAVKNAFENSISIVTGIPGSGKSYIIKYVIEKLHTNNNVFVLAPTGAAVERLRSENMGKLGAQVMTIQSFIYNNKAAEKKSKMNGNLDDVDEDHLDDPNMMVNNLCESDKNQFSPPTLYELYQFYDEFIFFIDETSMIDLGIFYKFLKIVSKIIKKVRLVVLGDKNQLPSIKGGYILNDLIACSVLKCTTLNGKHRSKNNDIMDNAKLILEGKDIDFDSRNVIFIEANNQEQIQKNLLKVIKSNNISCYNSCVLIPTRKGSLGINVFNPFLQNYYNPSAAPAVPLVIKRTFTREPKTPVPVDEKIYFRPNDKIIHGKNNKTKEIYNGSILIVDKVTYANSKPIYMECKYFQNETDINTDSANHRIIKYKDNNIILTAKDVPEEEKVRPPGVKLTNDFLEDNVELAYAMTVHKAQGKGYNIVIIIVHSDMYSQLLNRNLLYTAVTRSKQLCFIIGDTLGLDECKKIMKPRVTNLLKGTYISSKNTINFCESLTNDIITIRKYIDHLIEIPEVIVQLESYGINLSRIKSTKVEFLNFVERNKLTNLIVKNKSVRNDILRYVQ